MTTDDDGRQFHGSERRRIYLASRFANAEMLRGLRQRLVALDHEVTSSWVDCAVTAEDDARRDVDPDPAERASWARQDLADLLSSDTLVLIDPSGRRGGCYVEQGYAMAIGLDVIVVGKRTNVFTYLCEHAETIDDLLGMLS
jgi:nucleoside 2-deoxyribosyltransferase